VHSARKGVFALLTVMLGITGVTACRRPTPPPVTTTTTVAPPVTTAPTTAPPTTAPPTTAPPGTGTPPGVQKTVVRYGPYNVPAAAGAEMGMLENKIQGNAAKPCTADCYLTGMQAALVSADGTPLNVAQGLWLHHMVMFNGAKQDLTCPGKGPGLLGQRFFSSGNERTPTRAGGMYGYPQGAADKWTLLYDLMNMTDQAKSVYITVTYEHVPLATAGMKPITPLWFDINQCGNSERPAKTGQYSYPYSLTSQWTGKLLGIAGHLHDGGTDVVISQNGQVVCDSKATYGGDPNYIEGANSKHMPGMGHISKMGLCQGTPAAPVATIHPGDKLDLVANYDSNAHMQMGTHPVMGIAIGYFDMS
jgi:hypothetical protein